MKYKLSSDILCDTIGSDVYKKIQVNTDATLGVDSVVLTNNEDVETNLDCKDLGVYCIEIFSSGKLLTLEDKSKGSVYDRVTNVTYRRDLKRNHSLFGYVEIGMQSKTGFSHTVISQSPINTLIIKEMSDEDYKNQLKSIIEKSIDSERNKDLKDSVIINGDQLNAITNYLYNKLY